MATDGLRGHGPADAAYVQQWVNFADNEILPAACTWVFPCMGIMQYNKQVNVSCISQARKQDTHINLNLQLVLLLINYLPVQFTVKLTFLQATEHAKEEVKTALSVLNSHLETRTYLVGERISLADISVACNLLLLYQWVCIYDFIQRDKVTGFALRECKSDGIKNGIDT